MKKKIENAVWRIWSIFGVFIEILIFDQISILAGFYNLRLNIMFEDNEPDPPLKNG